MSAPAPAPASGSAFPYDQSTEPGFSEPSIDLTLPKTEEKKKATEKAPPKEKKVYPGLEAIPAPDLKLKRYPELGQTMPARIRKQVTYSKARQEIVEKAKLELASKNINVNANVLAEIKTRTISPDSKVTWFEQYKKTAYGQTLLAELRARDQEIKKLNDSILKAYIKSTTASDLHASWIANRERKIVTEEVYYIMHVLCKYILGSIVRDLIGFRMREIRASTKQFNTVELTNRTLESFILASIREPSVMASFPLAAHIYSLVAQSLKYFPEPVKVIGKKPEDSSTPAAEEETSSADDDEEDDQAVSLEALVVDIIRVTRSRLQEDDDTKKTAIRTSRSFKQLLDHIIRQFCDKVIRGIHIYSMEAKKKSSDSHDEVSGVKIGFEELHGRLNQLVCDHTDGVHEADKRANQLKDLEQFLTLASEDFGTVLKYKEAVNLVIFSNKNNLTTDDVTKNRTKARLLREEDELAKMAAKEGLTVEKYKESRAAQATKRAEQKKNAALKRVQEAEASLKAAAAKAAENETAWREKSVKLRELTAKPIIEPPAITLANPAISG